MQVQKVSLFWFRRDLRLTDNAGLFHALSGPYPVLPLFIFDVNILNDLVDRADARVQFIYQEIGRLKQELQAIGSDLYIAYGTPVEVFRQLMQDYPIAMVHTNRDFEPYAITRDKEISDLLSAQNKAFVSHKDHVIFGPDEILKDNGEPYVVFTPYSKKWKEKAQKTDRFLHFPSENLQKQFLKWADSRPMIPLADLSFSPSNLTIPNRVVPQKTIVQYAETRDFPALVAGTSRLGIHFRFGTISIREKARSAAKLSDVFLNELIWRDFYAQILAHFPHVVDGPFRPEYARIPWRDAPKDFVRWCDGNTGYPLVDAGMRELNATGHMHNRVRMVVASFLTKHLLINWQLGEAYFAQKLLDFDLASNNGGWQWAAGCGTDAAPYFRIFNPTEQAKRFDPKYEYIRKWVPELDGISYPSPMVEHKFARERCLAAYKTALQ